MRSVLITGGTGFFGNAAVARMLKDDCYDRICIFSRDEYKQSIMRAKFNDDGRLRWFIGDVRDVDRLSWAMDGVNLVIHAAALKRIEVGHENPIEMTKTNVDGAINVIAAARSSGVGKVVALSTDKAFQPCSAYGYSKAMAESLFLAANVYSRKNGTKYAVIRYGNVWKSTGSLVPTWQGIVDDGRNIAPVTDPDCTRFFMTADQAVSLVIDTAIKMDGGELVIPDYLPAYRVGDLAEAMKLHMDIRGLPAHEKKHEGMRVGLMSDTARRMSIQELREALYS